ncbi:ABC transporter permease [Actinomyces timonensis]|uniref:Transport permease protein n=1 Tax=Actinomyces timonensis TaxID=1288391 RepID=A0AAU8N783_9ACTO
MNLRAYASTVKRVLLQLLNDKRAIALIMAVPALLVTLLYFIYKDYPGGGAVFDRVAVQMIAILPMSVMFLITSITMLQERVSGTLERLWTTPMHRADLVVGYATALTVVAVGQALVLSAVCAWALGVTISGNWGWIILTALLDAFVGVSIGLLVSALSTTQFQAVQFMPLIVGVQVFLCGMLVPRGQLPSALELVSQVMPMSWAINAVGEVQARSAVTRGLVVDVVVLAAIGLVVLAAAPLTMPRRTR